MEYLDFECPFCARATGVANAVRAHFGDRLRYVPRHLPLTVHPHAELAAMAAESAGLQGRFWEMYERAVRELRPSSSSRTWPATPPTSASTSRSSCADLDDDRLHRRLERDLASAEASGVRGTPTFFVNGVRHVGPHDARSLIAALERADSLSGS